MTEEYTLRMIGVKVLKTTCEVTGFMYREVWQNYEKLQNFPSSWSTSEMIKKKKKRETEMGEAFNMNWIE